MRGNFSKLMVSSAFALLLGVSFPTMAKAATKKIPAQSKNVYSTSADINGDGKADAIKITTTKSKGYVSKITVSVNKKTAYTKALKSGSVSFIRAKYASMSKSKEFIQIIGYGDSDSLAMNQIYKYNTKSKKLVSVSSLNQGIATAGEITAASKDYITIKHSTQPAETGYITWTLPYKYTNNQLVAASSTSSNVKSVIGNYKKDKYTALFNKNQFVTAKKLTFYNGKKVGFVAPAKTTLTLKKVTLSDGIVYVQFQYGKKTGWAHVHTSNYDYKSPWFYGVNSRLVG